MIKVIRRANDLLLLTALNKTEHNFPSDLLDNAATYS